MVALFLFLTGMTGALAAFSYLVLIYSWDVFNTSKEIDRFCQVLVVSSDLVSHCEGLEKHLDDPVPNSGVHVLHCFGI
jgi:hypothetical protein